MTRPHRTVRTLSSPARVAGAGVLAAVLGAGCAAEDPGVLDVYAASSLTEAFTEMERAFEEAHPDLDARVTFAGSQVLRVQIEQGARADVFASANPDHVEDLSASGLVGPAAVFAGNELVVITPAGDPSGIGSFGELARASRLVLGTENVPVGIYARDVVRRAAAMFGQDFPAEVLSRVVSEEPNVRLVRAKVELEEADAAIVYRTDAAGADRVRVVPIPRELNVRAAYVMAPVLDPSRRPQSGGVGAAGTGAAEAWMAFVLSERGQAVLARHGFLRAGDVDS